MTLRLRSRGSEARRNLYFRAHNAQRKLIILLWQ